MISEKLKQIHQLALEIQTEAGINASKATTSSTRRYYAQLINSTELASILSFGGGFVDHTITRAEGFEKKLREEIFQLYIGYFNWNSK